MATNNRHSFSSTTSSPLPGAGDPITLIFSRNSMRNATFDCDSASIHYRVETPTEIFKTSRITSIYRWDKNTNEDTLVAEWERNVGADRMKLRRAGMLQDFLPVKDVIKTSYKFPFTTKRAFTGDNGKEYVWKERTSLKLYPAESDDTDNPIAVFHRPSYVFNKHKAYLQLQPEALETLDTLILTFLYAEKKRRDGEKAAAASAAAA